MGLTLGLDIGTTTLSVVLWDTVTGQLAARRVPTASRTERENPMLNAHPSRAPELVLPVSDASLLAGHVDLALLVVGWPNARPDTVDAASARLRQAAGRHGADVLLMVDGVGSVDRYDNGYAALYPTLAGAYGSYFFDHQGRPAAATPLIIPGTLARRLEDAVKRREDNYAAFIRSLGSSLAAKGGSREALVHETADLWFHSLVMLSRLGSVHASEKSYNNHWGVPLSLARLPRDAAFAVFEIGMSQAGEITPLTRLVRPHVAIVTTIAPSHLGHFPSLAAIADAKAEIFAGVEPGGAAVINRDSDYFDRLAAAARQSGIARIVGFGEHEAAEVRLTNVALHETCSCVTADVLGDTVSYRLGAPGRHLALNSLAVLAAARLAGGDLARAAMALARLEPQKGRGVRFRLDAPDGTITVIDESYNANPASMAATLAVLGEEPAAGRRVAVLGAMRELGAESARFHAALAGPIAAAKVDYAILIGEEMAALAKALGGEVELAHVPDAATATRIAREAIGPGDAVLVKGSNSIGLAAVVEALASGSSVANQSARTPETAPEELGTEKG